MGPCRLLTILDQTMHLFYSCTQLPITALTNQTFPREGSLAQKLGLQFHDYRERELILPGQDQEKRFYLCPICPHGGKAGLFILGPYHSEEKKKAGVSYRPPEALPHLVSLLRNLQRTEWARLNNRPYCLHVQRAVKMISAGYAQEISLESTARSLGLNKSYFSALFRENTGQTFTEFVQEVRIKESKKLLANPALSVLEIALQVGFNNQNYFARIFKKLTGVSPSEFRQKIDLSSSPHPPSTEIDPAKPRFESR
ncbi:MAG: helix-turn-helix transcriptional regulator [Firmicutes bacterium]|nr:helix-turn-helix transcriptional regulator [Bacillota bacterium]